MHRHASEVTRREFMRAGGALTAAATGLTAAAVMADEKTSALPPLAKRKLGKTGVQVSMLNQGAAMKMDNRLLNTAWNEGVRYFDSADCYQGGGSEKFIGEWLQKNGRRKDIFIVTKDHPETPDQWVKMIDKRLETLQTDYVDLFFIHELGKGFGSVKLEAAGIPKDKEWAKAADKLKKSGKVRLTGFSSHTRLDLRTALLNDAAEGWVDALMVASNPTIVRENTEFNKALDNCHRAGVGLICMKEMRGTKTIPDVVPEFEKMGLTKHAAVLHAVWTDERFSSICSAMNNVKIIKENAESARTFKPLTKEQLGMVDEVMKRYAGAFCAGCDGRCSMAAGTTAALGDIARYLSYFEQDGDRATARRLYRELPPELRDWSGADLEAASEACVSRIEFADLLKRAEAKLA